jgi:hypothetical protein
LGGPVYGQERIVNKADEDMIFGFTRAQWEEHAKKVIHPEGWTVSLRAFGTGTVVSAFDPKTGMGMSVQPLFGVAGPPDMIVIGSYYPAGTFGSFDDALKQRTEEAARLDLGPKYLVSVILKKQEKFEIIDILISRSDLPSQTK